MKKRFLIFLSIICLWIIQSGPSSIRNKYIASQISGRIHVTCKCINSWTNGKVKNLAEVELRDSTSFGPVLLGASVDVNAHQLLFDKETQIYKGSIGKVEQWQRIPLLIQTQDGRNVKGYVAVVFMVRITRPKPFATVPSNQVLPVAWEYSEGSMHTVDLEILRDKGDPVGLEVIGNKTSIDFRKLGLEVDKGETIIIRVLPPWTSNYEFSGNLTRRSKANFITEATIAIRF